MSELDVLSGGEAAAILDGLAQTSPIMSGHLAHAVESVLARLELTRRERQLLTLASLAAQGAERQLHFHAGAFLRVGLEAEEVAAVMEHAAIYAGFPRALTAMAVVREVVAEKGVSPAPSPISVEAGGRVQRLLDVGPRDGPVLVLLHPLALDHRVWRVLIRALATTHRVIAPDLRGHGELGRETLDDVGAASDDVVELMRSLGIRRASVLGLSMGGAVAQRVALDHPAVVERLVLAGTFARGAAAFEARASESAQAQADATLARWFRSEDLSARPWGVRYAAFMLERAEDVRWAAAWRAAARHDVREALSSISVPTLVLAGEMDVSTPPDAMRDLATAIPGASFAVLPRAPHLMVLTHANEVASAVGGFLSAGDLERVEGAR